MKKIFLLAFVVLFVFSCEKQTNIEPEEEVILDQIEITEDIVPDYVIRNSNNPYESYAALHNYSCKYFQKELGYKGSKAFQSKNEWAVIIYDLAESLNVEIPDNMLDH